MGLHHRLNGGIEWLERITHPRATGDHTPQTQIDTSNLVQEGQRLAHTQPIAAVQQRDQRR